MYNKFKNVANIVKDNYEPVISNRGRFFFFQNRDNSRLLPQVGKSILR
jgi:hypothetical protein